MGTVTGSYGPHYTEALGLGLGVRIIVYLLSTYCLKTLISVNLLGCTPSHEALLPPPSALLLCHGHSHRWTRPLYKGGDHVNIAGVEPQHQPQLNRARSRGSSASSHRVCPSAADTPQCDCSEEPPGLVVACNRFLSLP